MRQSRHLAYLLDEKFRAGQIQSHTVDGGEGPVAPSLETVSNGTYSPLSRPLFIYVNSSAAKKEQVVSFVSFYLENAALLAEEVGYVPLPEEETAKEIEKFNAFVAGLE